LAVFFLVLEFSLDFSVVVHDHTQMMSVWLLCDNLGASATVECNVYIFSAV